MAEDSDDAESQVVRRLSVSSRRARLTGLLPGIVLGVGALFPVFLLMSELQWLVMDRAFVLVSGGAAAGAMLGLILAGRWVGEQLWRLRRAPLCRSLARQHGLDEEQVEELANLFSS